MNEELRYSVYAISIFIPSSSLFSLSLSRENILILFIECHFCVMPARLTATCLRPCLGCLNTFDFSSSDQGAFTLFTLAVISVNYVWWSRKNLISLLFSLSLFGFFIASSTIININTKAISLPLGFMSSSLSIRIHIIRICFLSLWTSCWCFICSQSTRIILWTTELSRMLTCVKLE